MSKTLTTVQEVYFDLCDILDNNDYSSVKVEGLFDFEDLQEFLVEQKRKLAEIELSLDLNREVTL
jgi:hypothetical protein